jgi:hypothetical protein
MCLCLQAHPAVEGNEVEDVVLSIHWWGKELVSWLMLWRRASGEAGQICLTDFTKVSNLHQFSVILFAVILSTSCLQIFESNVCCFLDCLKIKL